MSRLRARPDECHFWRAHDGAELDLLVTSGRHRIGYQFTHTSTPSLTTSMRIAPNDLKLE